MKAVISHTSSVSGMTTPAILSAAVVDMCNSWNQRLIGLCLWTESGLFVVGVEGQEGQSGGGARRDLRHQIHPQRRPREDSHRGTGEGDRRVERATGDVAARDATGQYREPDGQAVEGVGRVVFTGRHVQYDVAECKREQQLNDERREQGWAVQGQ